MVEGMPKVICVDHHHRGERGPGVLCKEHLDHFALIMLDPANNPGKNTTHQHAFHPTSIDLANPVSYFSSQTHVSQEASSMLDLPPGRLVPHPKLILTRFRPHDFGLETIGRKADRVGRRDELPFTPFTIYTSVLLCLVLSTGHSPRLSLCYSAAPDEEIKQLGGSISAKKYKCQKF